MRYFPTPSHGASHGVFESVTSLHDCPVPKRREIRLATSDSEVVVEIHSICFFLVLWKFGFMKTTLEIPDDLFREAKAKAALEGRKLKDVVAEGLRLAISGAPLSSQARRTKFPLISKRHPSPIWSSAAR